MEEEAQRILDFWFDGVEEDTVLVEDSDVHRWWFDRSEEMNRKIARGFKSDVRMAGFSDYNHWGDTSKGRLALIIVLDQFTRCVHYGTGRAYENDLEALRYVLLSIKTKEDIQLTYLERVFLYLPLMHSENVEIQEMSLRLYKSLSREAAEEGDINVNYLKDLVQNAEKYYNIIQEFKRFPHRNKLLKRKSTSTENNFIQNVEGVID